MLKTGKALFAFLQRSPPYSSAFAADDCARATAVQSLFKEGVSWAYFGKELRFVPIGQAETS